MQTSLALVRTSAAMLGKRKRDDASQSLQPSKHSPLPALQVQIVNGKLIVRLDGASKKSKSSAAASHATDDAGQPFSEDEADAEEGMETPRLRSRSASSKPKVRYFCSYEGCGKSYTKPVRLAEHIRSHTGERPFRCPQKGCGQSYLRETHLQAHMRSHVKNEQEKPLECGERDCDKRFWTNQHLKRHVKLVHEQDKDAYKVR